MITADDGRRREYSWQDPAVSAAAARELDGMAFFNELLAGRLPRARAGWCVRGTVAHFGSRTALAHARLTDEGGKLYAEATSNCLIFRPDPTAP